MRSFSLILFFCALIYTSTMATSIDGTEPVPVAEPGDIIPSILLESVLNNDFDGIRRALDNGESIDLTNDRGWSAARFAVETGNLAILNELIQNQIDLNNPDADGITPLMAAAAMGDREAVQVLLDNNASPLQKTVAGDDVYSFASRSNRKVITTLIAEAATIHGINSEDIAEVLSSLRHGSFVNIRNAAGWTPLILASARNDLEAVKEILAQGADPDRTENDGWSALHFAADVGADKIVDELLKSGANTNIRNNNNLTARELAMSHNFLTIVDKIPEATEEL